MSKLITRISVLVLFALPVACDDEKADGNDKTRTGAPATPAAGSAPADQKPVDAPGRTPEMGPGTSRTTPEVGGAGQHGGPGSMGGETPRPPGTGNDDPGMQPKPTPAPSGSGGTQPRPPGSDTKTTDTKTSDAPSGNTAGDPGTKPPGT